MKSDGKLKTSIFVDLSTARTRTNTMKNINLCVTRLKTFSNGIEFWPGTCEITPGKNKYLICVLGLPYGIFR